MSDDIIISYIKNSGAAYSLSVDDILYLNSQGVSQSVIPAFSKQPAGRASPDRPRDDAWLHLPPPTPSTSLPMPSPTSADDYVTFPATTTPGYSSPLPLPTTPAPTAPYPYPAPAAVEAYVSPVAPAGLGNHTDLFPYLPGHTADGWTWSLTARFGNRRTRSRLRDGGPI